MDTDVFGIVAILFGIGTSISKRAYGVITNNCYFLKNLLTFL